MCEAILAIDAAARNGALGGAAGDEVTVEVTAKVTVEGSANEKPPTTLEVVGGELEREKGFELNRPLAANFATTRYFPGFVLRGEGFRRRFESSGVRWRAVEGGPGLAGFWPAPASPTALPRRS
jgi:hypothetical protein